MPVELIPNDQSTTFTPLGATPLPSKPVPTWGESFDAAFHLENDVVNAYEFLNRPVFKADPAMDVEGELKKRNLWNTPDRKKYFPAESVPELEWMIAKSGDEQRRRDVAARSGWTGFGFGMLAGIASPTMLLPVIGEARGVRAFFESASLAALAGSIQESVLQMNQIDRTVEEGVKSVAMQTVLGGILGGTIKNLSPREVERISFDMANAHDAPTISRPMPLHDTPTPPTRPSFDITRRTDSAGQLRFEGPTKASGIVSGELSAVDRPNVLEVTTSRVAPSERGQGLGTAIYRDAIDYALTNGKPLVSASTVSDDAIRVYKSLERAGYKVEVNPRTVRTKTGVMSEDSRQPVYRVTAEPKAPVVAQAQPAGAAVLRAADAGGIAVEPGLLKFVNVATNELANLSLPVWTLKQNVMRTARYGMGRFSDFGLRREGQRRGVMGSPGGTIEFLQRGYDRYTYMMQNHVDEGYQKYRLGKSGQVFGNLRATVAGNFGSKMSKQEFREEVTRAMNNASDHPVPEVAQVAKSLDSEVYQPLLKAALDVGAIPKDFVEQTANKGFVNYVYNPDMVTAYRPEFIKMVADTLKVRLEADFHKKWSKFIAKQATDKQALADASLSAEEANKLRDQFLEELKAKEPLAIEDQLAQARQAVRDAKGREAKAKAREEVKRLKELGGEPLKTITTARSELRRRIKNLNKSAALYGERQAAKLDKIDNLENMQLASLERTTRKASKMLASMSQFSDAEMARNVRELRNDFAKVAGQYDKTEEKIVATMGQDLTYLGDTQNVRAGRLSEIAKELHDVEGLDPGLTRVLIEEGMRDILFKVNGINNRRAAQMTRLADEAAKLDPKIAKNWAERLGARIADRKTEFRDMVREKLHANDPNVDLGQADFTEYATDIAKQAAGSIDKTSLRLPFMEALQGPRGTELARSLDLPYAKVEKFLEKDIEKLVRSYVRTLSGDIEIAKVFGTPAADQLFLDMQQEFEALSARVPFEKDSRGRPLSEKAQVQRQADLKNVYKNAKLAIESTISRVRHTWGIPTNPSGMAYRLGSAMQQVSAGRFLGGVLIASIPDPWRVVMKHSLTSTFSASFDAATSGLKSLRISKKQAQMSGEALDVVRHSRLLSLANIMEDIGRKSKFERGLEYATSKIGLIGGFDYWTVLGKTFTSAVRNVEMTNAIDKFLHAPAGSKEVADATEYLAGANLLDQYPERVWAALTAPGGGWQSKSGNWYPNMENWKDPELVQAYGAALSSDIAHTIITPGLEQALWMNKTLAGKMLSQFRSFSMASTFKTTMHAAQQRDAAILIGISGALAMGALSDYLWAVSIGGATYERYKSASLGEHADRAIARSGMDAVFGILGGVADKIVVDPQGHTAAQKLGLRFSASRVGATAGNDLVTSILGPNADLLETTASVLVSMGHPTKSTIHKLRQVIPFQNLFYIRRLLDDIERKAAEDYPGRSPVQ